MTGNKNTTIKNFIWRFAERCGAQLVTFIVSIVLARLLAPEDYGTIALVTVFTTILQVFVDSGLGTALIQKKDADDLDFSSVFYFNFFMCIVLYIGMFLAAPIIAGFYGDSSLIPIIRVISLTIVISGVKGIQQSYVSRNMLFKRFFFATLGGTIFSAFLGIGLAYAGFGVWAIVAQQLSNTAIDTLILWITVKWRPQKMFSWNRLKGLLSFGWKLLVSSLLDTVYNNLRNLIIGKFYSSADLAYYNQGDKFPKLIVTNINNSIDSVLLPTLSSAQDDRERVKNMTRRAIKTINAMGRSDYFLKLEIAKKAIGMILLLSTMHFGVMVMAYSLLVSTVTSMIINSWPNKTLLGYSFKEQMVDIFPGIFLALIMGIAISLIRLLMLPDIVTLAIQILVGAAIYIGLSAIFKVESFEYLWNMVKSVLNKK